MIGEKSIGSRAFNIGNGILLCLLGVITLYPFYYVLMASFSDPKLLIKNEGLLLLPLGFYMQNYVLVLTNSMILLGFRNTLFYVAAGASVNLVLTTLGAFVLSRRNLFWKKILMFTIVFTMFFDVGLIPMYLLVQGLKMTDTVFAVIIPSAINVWYLIIMRTSFMSIPASMEEMAKIDGANELTVLLRIVLPLSASIMAVMVLFYGVTRWNAWFDAMIYIRNRELFPLQLFLQEILTRSSANRMSGVTTKTDKVMVEVTIKYATIIVVSLPIIFIYPFVQRYFIKGIMVGALKE